MKTRHCATLRHRASRGGDATAAELVCATAPPAPPPLGVAGGGGAACSLTVVETPVLHDGEPVAAWSWDAPEAELLDGEQSHRLALGR